MSPIGQASVGFVDGRRPRALRLWCVVCLPCVLVACGRWNFDAIIDAGGDSGPAPNEIAIVAHARGGETTASGAAIVGAHVLVEGVEVALTDAQGHATIQADTPITFEVVYGYDRATGGAAWRVYTYVDVAPSTTISMGSHVLDASSGGTMTVDLAPSAGATAYALSVPLGCLYGQTSAGTSITLEYTSECANTIVPLIALSWSGSGPMSSVELGDVLLADGSNFSGGVGWSPLESVRITGHTFPGGMCAAGVLRTRPSGSTSILTNQGSIAAGPGGATAFPLLTAPGGNLLLVIGDTGTTTGIATVLPVAATDGGDYDVNLEAPLLSKPAVNGSVVSWTVGQNTADAALAVVDFANASPVEWRIYTSPRSGTRPFPTLTAAFAETELTAASTIISTEGRVLALGAPAPNVFTLIDFELDNLVKLSTATGGVSLTIIQ